jgi:hypothetical protein
MFHQAQNEAEISTLKGVIERLRQSIEELAAAAQVIVQRLSDALCFSLLCLLRALQELNGLRSALSEKNVKNLQLSARMFINHCFTLTCPLSPLNHVTQSRNRAIIK